MNSNELKQARARLRLSQKQLGDLCGRSVFQISRMENDGAPVPDYLDTLIFLLELQPGNVNAALDYVAERNPPLPV